MIKALVFDLDGTLVDTLKDLAVTTNEVLKKYNYSEIEIDKYRYFVGNGIKKLIERALIYVNGNLEYLDAIYNEFINEYEVKYLRFAKVYEGISELLNILKEHNVLLFVNTNKKHEIAVNLISKLLPNYFISIYGDSLFYPRKPNPFIINKIMNDFNLNNNEILYVGDSDVDVFTAHNANIKVIGCNYGFRGEKELKDAKSDYLINSPLEIIKILKL